MHAVCISTIYTDNYMWMENASDLMHSYPLHTCMKPNGAAAQW